LLRTPRLIQGCSAERMDGLTIVLWLRSTGMKRLLVW
jgi:hypothetical protein